MGEIEKIKEKIKNKKWGKEEWIIVILAGVFLLIVFWPTQKNEDGKETQSTSKNGEKESEGEGEDAKKDELAFNYKEHMEKQLEEVLKSIDGIDSVKVMLTLQSSQEEIVLKETHSEKEMTSEQDSQGGKREIETQSLEETVCYNTKDGENKGPYITYTISPKVEGVLVVAGGSMAGSLRTQIVKAVQALFDVESHKVVVIKMKEA